MPVVNSVCIVDDDPVFIFSMKKFMELSGFCYNFLEFSNGSDALDGLTPLLKKPATLPDIIFVDANMPVMDGWEFLEALFKYKVPKKVKVYLTTSSSAQSDLIKAKSLPYLDGYIVKPFSLEQLDEVKAAVQV
jgi:CheY-like chemotaxis protein